MKSLVIRAPFYIRSGYETLTETICLELSKQFDVFPISMNGEITNPTIKKLSRPLSRNITKNTELCILPIQSDINDYNLLFRIPKIGKRIFFTMWESTQLSMNVVDLLNKGKCVIVPNSWNKENFEIDGVTVPIVKCPLFVDTSIFKYKSHIDNGFFTFGSSNADPRKRLNDVIRCFCKAFSVSVKDVKLKIKIDSQDLNKLVRFSDDRVEVSVQKLTKPELSNWYHNIDVFVSGTSSEGWGLMQHESMACGRPIIAPHYSGLKEFFDSSVGLPLKYEEVPSEWSWGYSNGFWSKFNEDDMINKLRWCYNNPDKIISLGKKSAKRAKKYDIENFTHILTNILIENGD
jgi:glycosyltransferase involved in cell wall biosynthesis